MSETRINGHDNDEPGEYIWRRVAVAAGGYSELIKLFHTLYPVKFIALFGLIAVVICSGSWLVVVVAPAPPPLLVLASLSSAVGLVVLLLLLAMVAASEE